jgi:hypothetical protein
MEVRITITDGVVTAETHGGGVPGAGAASHVMPGVQGALHPTSGGSFDSSIGAAVALGAINAGPAPVGLSASQQGAPMPFITGAQQGPGARPSMDPNLPADESGGPASFPGPG